MDVEKILSSLVRIGIVTAVNNDKYLARVKFDDQDLPSGCLRTKRRLPYCKTLR